MHACASMGCGFRIPKTQANKNWFQRSPFGIPPPSHGANLPSASINSDAAASSTPRNPLAYPQAKPFRSHSRLSSPETEASRFQSGLGMSAKSPCSQNYPTAPEGYLNLFFRKRPPSQSPASPMKYPGSAPSPRLDEPRQRTRNGLLKQHSGERRGQNPHNQCEDRLQTQGPSPQKLQTPHQENSVAKIILIGVF